MVVFKSWDEVIVCEDSKEELTLKTWFAPDSGRNPDAFDRKVCKDVVAISTTLYCDID
jgi:hypothetical protein